MVIGKERTNWYEGHESACICADCVTRTTAQRRFDSATQDRKVGRNEKCPSGTGKKNKKCHRGDPSLNEMTRKFDSDVR